jgi:hypothetical protein
MSLQSQGPQRPSEFQAPETVRCGCSGFGPASPSARLHQRRKALAANRMLGSRRCCRPRAAARAQLRVRRARCAGTREFGQHRAEFSPCAGIRAPASSSKPPSRLAVPLVSCDSSPPPVTISPGGAAPGIDRCAPLRGRPWPSLRGHCTPCISLCVSANLSSAVPCDAMYAACHPASSRRPIAIHLGARYPRRGGLAATFRPFFAAEPIIL